MFKVIILILKFSCLSVQSLLHIVRDRWWLVSLSCVVVACQHQIRWVLRHFKIHHVRVVFSSIFLSGIVASTSKWISFVCSRSQLFGYWVNTCIVELISININNERGHVQSEILVLNLVKHRNHFQFQVKNLLSSIDLFLELYWRRFILKTCHLKLL